MTSTYKFSGVGLDTSNLTYIPSVISDENTNYDYYYTNINANNGLVLRPLLNRSSNARLVVGVDFLDHVSLAIREHLYELGEQRVNVLLIDAGCDWEKYEDEIKVLQESGIVEEIGIKNPEKLNVDALEYLRVKFGIRYLGINLCPLYYWKDIMDWSEMVGLKVFGFNPFGGHISAPSLIDAFTLPYLLNFSAMHTDVVFLSGKDIVFSDVNRDYLLSIIGKEDDEALYRVKKDVDKLLKPLKRLGHLSLHVGEESFPLDETDLIFNPEEFEISLGSEKLDFDTTLSIEEDDKAGQDIMKYLEDAYLPEDTNNPKDYLAIIRPKAFALFRACYPEGQGWLNTNVFIGGVYVFNSYREIRHKFWFSKDKVDFESHTYILYYSNGTGFVLRNLQNSEPKS